MVTGLSQAELRFSTRSMQRLEECDIRLQRIACAAIINSPVDFGITCGHRGEEDQEKACAAGNSKVHFPDSKHNSFPAMAFDFVPTPGGHADWDDVEKFKKIAAHIIAIATRMNVKIRWGGDWNMNGVEDEKWYDRPHIELVD